MLRLLLIVLLLSVIFTEFRANSNWDCNVPVHPKLSLHKSQDDYCHVNKLDLHSTST